MDREHGGDLRKWARYAGVDPAELVDFSASINPLGPPPSARRAFQKSYQAVTRYPDPYGEELKEALAKHHGMSAAEILLGNGSTQLIYLLSFAIRPREALVLVPAFSEYANALQLAGAKVRFVSLVTGEGFRFSAESFMAAWTKGIDVAFLTTPNSVTGQLIPRAEIEKIAAYALAQRKFLVADEAFMDFTEAESSKRLVRNNPYLIILRSLTKFYALPGLRLGYLVAHNQTAARFAAYLEPWSVNGPAEKVALACLADRSFRLKTERWLRRERDFLTRSLTGLRRFDPYPSSANFILVRIGNDATAVDLRSFLLTKKILIRACDSLTSLSADHFRVAVKERKHNQLLIAGLNEWNVGSFP